MAFLCDAPMRTPELITFLTPYWTGREMMHIHLRSIRQFYPTAPILISKTGGGLEEMEAYRVEFRTQYWLEDCNFTDAMLRLFSRCKTEYVCFIHHDAVLLSTLDPLLKGLIEGSYDIVGIEDRIREPGRNDWLRFAPGYMDSSFMMLNWRDFLRTWGLRGIRWKEMPGIWHREYHYGISQKLRRHYYLQPFHVSGYGLANLLRDAETPVLWHQWYGSHQKRLDPEHEGIELGVRELIPVVQQGESAFVRDYPNLDLSDLLPAWGPECDIQAAELIASKLNPTGTRAVIARALTRVRTLSRHRLRGLARIALARLGRWRRLL